MAFSILSDLFRCDSEKYVRIPPNTEDKNDGSTGIPVLKKTMPTKRLVDRLAPHEYTNRDNTDISRHWRK